MSKSRGVVRLLQITLKKKKQNHLKKATEVISVS